MPSAPISRRRPGSAAPIAMLVAFVVAGLFGLWLARKHAEERRAAETPPPAPVTPAPAPAPKPVETAPALTAEQLRDIAIEELEATPAPAPKFNPKSEIDKPVSPVRRPASLASDLEKRVWAAVAPSAAGKSLATAPFKVPGRGTPERAALAALLADYAKIPPEQMLKHPLAKEFPGDVAESVPRLRTLFTCTRGVKGWTSTGFYAPPGELITVELSEDDAKRGLSVLIGTHTDNLDSPIVTEWKRFPAVTRSFPLDKTTVKIANPFGGLIVITDAHRVRPERPLQLRFTGVVKAPQYLLGKTSPLTWAKLRTATNGVPWGEILSDRVALVLPGNQLRACQDPAPYANHWDKVVKAHYKLAGVDKDPLRHERITADAQPAYGCMHPGYPIVMRLAQAPAMTGIECLNDDNWGVNHEIGHNLQRPEWTFAGYSEVTCNLFGLHAMETVSGLKITQVRGGMNWRAIQTQSIAFPGDDDPFILLSAYTSPIVQFGWEPLRKTFATYDTNPIPAGLSDEDKKAEFIYRWSVACGVDLRDYAALFGFPRNAHSAARFASAPAPLKPWMPEGCPPPVTGVKRITRTRDLNTNEDSHLEARRLTLEAAAGK